MSTSPFGEVNVMHTPQLRHRKRGAIRQSPDDNTDSHHHIKRCAMH